jgi:hypothetical protein
MDPPEWLQKVYDGGNVHEEMNAAALRENGYRIEEEQAEVRLEVAGCVVIGHLDGRLTRHPRDIFANDELVWESKSPAAWEKFQKAYATAARKNGDELCSSLQHSDELWIWPANGLFGLAPRSSSRVDSSSPTSSEVPATRR